MDLLEGHKVSVAELPPIMLPLLSPTRATSLRLLSVGGEKFLSSVLDGWFEGGRRIFNGYGPTEATVAVVHAQLRSSEGAHPPIGVPMGACHAYVLDEQLRPVPVSAAGELYLAGPTLAYGYVNSTTETAAVFLPDPFSATPGARMYKTGDLVRLNSAGELEILGRVDRQVKLRGHRIELREIEIAAQKHPAVAVACAELAGENASDRALVLYYVSAKPSQSLREELLNHLRRSLPSYMVPSFLVPIRQLPINASGKLNRASLPRPTSQDRVGAPKRGRTFRAAESEIATRIVAAAIGADVPAPDVSLFDLGVNSLQLMQIAARFQSAYGVDVQLGAFFRRPTVEALATMLTASLTGSPARHEQAPDVVETARSKPLETEGPISLNQRRILENPYLAGSDEAVMQSGFSIAGPMDVDAFRETVLVLQQQHRVLRTWITASSSTRQTLQSPVPVRDHNFVHLPAQSRLDAVRAVARAAKMAIAGVRSRPLFSVDLCHLEANDHAVVITVHHAIFDGWSWGVLLKSMNAIYAHLVRHEHPPAAPAAIDYISFAAAQSEHLASAGFAHKKGKPCLVRIAELTRACGPRDAQKAEGLLRLEAWERTKEAATNFGISPFCVLLSAFGLAVSRRYGVTRFSVFVPSADRISTHVQEAVGYFANAMQIDFEFAGDSRFEETVATVQRQVGSLSATPDYTFGLKDVDRHIRQTGMGSFVFALQNAPTTVFLDLPGCNIMRLMVGAHTHLPPIRRFYSFDGAEVAVSLAMELTEQGLAYHLEAMSEGLYQPDLIDDMLTIVGALFPDEHVE